MATKKKSAKKSVAKKIVKAMKKSKPVRTIATMTVAQVKKAVAKLRKTKDYDHDDGNFFGYNAELHGCCGVLELHGLSVWESAVLTKEESYLVSRLYLDDVLDEHSVKLAIATTANQPEAEELLSTLGFKAVESARNPKSGRTITIWTYRRGK